MIYYMHISLSYEVSGIYRPEAEETPEKLLNELPKGQGIKAETLRQTDGATTFL